MSSYWLKNFVGIRQTDFEMLHIPHPKVEFCIHVSLRSIQTGAVLGSLLAPLSALANRDDRRRLRDQFVEGGKNGAIIGALLGPVLTCLALRNMNSIQVYDKCLRLRYDKSQLWQDRSCILSATLGALTNGTAGFVVGIDIAQAMHYLAHFIFGK